MNIHTSIRVIAVAVWTILPTLCLHVSLHSTCIAGTDSVNHLVIHVFLSDKIYGLSVLSVALMHSVVGQHKVVFTP